MLDLRSRSKTSTTGIKQGHQKRQWNRRSFSSKQVASFVLLTLFISVLSNVYLYQNTKVNQNKDSALDNGNIERTEESSKVHFSEQSSSQRFQQDHGILLKPSEPVVSHQAQHETAALQIEETRQVQASQNQPAQDVAGHNLARTGRSGARPLSGMQYSTPTYQVVSDEERMMVSRSIQRYKRKMGMTKDHSDTIGSLNMTKNDFERTYPRYMMPIFRIHPSILQNKHAPDAFKIAVFPMFGLCNRLRVLAYAAGLQQCYLEYSIKQGFNPKYEFYMYWYKYPKLNSTFQELFTEGVFEELNSWESMMPGSGEILKVYSLFKKRKGKEQHISMYGDLDLSDERIELIEQNMMHPKELLRHATGKQTILASAWPRQITDSYSYCMKSGRNRMLKGLQPVPSIQSQIDELLQKAASMTNNNHKMLVGIHIRTTDKRSQNDGTTAGILDVVKILTQLSSEDPKLVFYISSDSQLGLDRAKAVLGPDNILHAGNGDRERGSSNGMAKAVVDLWMLSYCYSLYTTARSSVFHDYAVLLARSKRGFLIERRHVIRPSNNTKVPEA